MQLSVRPARLGDASSLAPRLRASDIQEILAAGSPGPEASLRQGVELSTVSFAVVDEDDHPQLLMGVVPTGDPMAGYVWMLSADILTTHQITLMKWTPAWLDVMHRHFPVLTNAVDARNLVHIRWLKRMGFTFLETVHGYGPGHPPFLTFMRLHHV